MNLYIESCLFSIFLNDDIVDIEIPVGMCLLTFAVDDCDFDQVLIF